MEIQKLIRNSLRNFVVYKPGEQPSGTDWTKLNTNENPYPPIDNVIEVIKQNCSDQLRLYPDPEAKELREKLLFKFLKKFTNINSIDWILIGNGSDELIDLIAKLFINPEDKVYGFHPSYGMYETIASYYGANYIKLQLTREFGIPDKAYNVDGKLFFINSPNNPNGKSFNNKDIAKICENFSGIVVVDEAYADFSTFTALRLLNKFENLVILRTFSKSCSLAALRIGYCVANPIVITELRKVKLPYNSNFISQKAGVACLDFWEEIVKQNKKVIEERSKMIFRLSSNKNLNVFSSDANFILVKFANKNEALRLYTELRNHKILVRYYDNPELNKFLRISIGKSYENERVLDIFGKKIIKNL